MENRQLPPMKSGTPPFIQNRGDFVSYGIWIDWTDGRWYNYDGYKSRDLAESHYRGFCDSQVVRRATLYGKGLDGTLYFINQQEMP